MTLTQDLAAVVDPHFDALYASGTVPGIAYGILHQGTLLHTRGLGMRDLSGGESQPTTPDADTVFRIASMTKSFTAATLLSLREEGLVGFDEPAAAYVPQLAAAGGACPRVTVRQLLTMSAGFATDDPWGDRQQDLDPDDFAVLLETSVQPMWRPGRRFEYSNLGYAVLGRVIEAVTNMQYREVVAARILRPLGMSATGFDVAAIPEASVATGYVRRGEQWVVEPIDPYGAFAPMGGLLSTVTDLSRWVGLMLTADRSETPPVRLSTDSLLEMQTGQRFVEAVCEPTYVEAPEPPTVRHYGYGLFEELLPWGRCVSHSGGYPGFGSHMRWHAESGLGIVALGNRTYAPMAKISVAALEAAVTAGLGDGPPSVVNHSLQAARDVVNHLVNQWDDQLAGEWFTDNVAQDEPWEVRRSSANGLRERHGPLTPDPTEQPLDTGPAHTTWWLVGAAGGRVKVELLLSPHSVPRIQWVSWTSVPDPGPALVAAATEALRMVDPLATVGRAVGGDGSTSATFCAEGPLGASEVKVGEGAPPRVRRTPRSVAVR